MNKMLFEYRHEVYPSYLRDGNAMQFIEPVARQFCHGRGVDVGCGSWPLLGAIPVELKDGGDAMNLPDGPFDYVASSHCLEHLVNPVAALEHWRERLRRGGTLFLYLPHPDQKYWRPQNCRKHLHSWLPRQMATIVRDLGFTDVIHSERDMAWSFCLVGFKA
jgi:SAM-dependent methyltransferase